MNLKDVRCWMITGHGGSTQIAPPRRDGHMAKRRTMTGPTPRTIAKIGVTAKLRDELVTVDGEECIPKAEPMYRQANNVVPLFSVWVPPTTVHAAEGLHVVLRSLTSIPLGVPGTSFGPYGRSEGAFAAGQQYDLQYLIRDRAHRECEQQRPRKLILARFPDQSASTPRSATTKNPP